MNGPGHYAAAERLVTIAGELPPTLADDINPAADRLIAEAQVHATLAAAAATAQSGLFDDQDVQEWFAVIHDQRNAANDGGSPGAGWRPYDRDDKTGTAPQPDVLVWIFEETEGVTLGFFDGFTFRTWGGSDDCSVSWWAPVDYPASPGDEYRWEGADDGADPDPDYGKDLDHEDDEAPATPGYAGDDELGRVLPE